MLGTLTDQMVRVFLALLGPARRQTVMDEALVSRPCIPAHRQPPLVGNPAHKSLASLADHADFDAALVKHLRGKWQRLATHMSGLDHHGTATDGLEPDQ